MGIYVHVFWDFPLQKPCSVDNLGSLTNPSTLSELEVPGSRLMEVVIRTAIQVYEASLAELNEHPFFNRITVRSGLGQLNAYAYHRAHGNWRTWLESAY